MTTTATPAKLRNGSWGARIEAPVKAGDTITITTRGGKSWQARVTKILWTGDGASIVATESLDRPAGSQPARTPGRCVKCGDPIAPQYRVCLNCKDGGGNARGGQSYYDRNGRFVLGDDD
jgi:hypothetical protein